MRVVIGLVGFKGAGKDTVGNFLVSRGFTKDSFAASLKDAVAGIFSWDRTLLEGDTQESRTWRESPDPYWTDVFGYDVIPRQVLQKFGTESMRNVFHPDIWIEILKRRIESSPSQNIVITDVRFVNEIAMIRELGGLIVRVKRGEDPLWWHDAELANQGIIEARWKMANLSVHLSEWDWIGTPFDALIENDGTLDHLEHEVTRLILDKHHVIC